MIQNKDRFIESSIFEIKEENLKEKIENKNVLDWILSNENVMDALCKNYILENFELRVNFFIQLKDLSLIKQFKDFYASNQKKKEFLDRLNKIFLIQNLPNFENDTPNPEVRNFVNENMDETSINEGTNDVKAG